MSGGRFRVQSVADGGGGGSVGAAGSVGTLNATSESNLAVNKKEISHMFYSCENHALDQSITFKLVVCLSFGLSCINSKLSILFLQKSQVTSNQFSKKELCD
ncbi:hypothetical protein CRE_16917 [Caenorhabditis remanei]|uniref:Uncharacterized protein n=1 Tax=Caenorhabditis remanei TaxID=31234 RepID=E3MSE1_CAERE|nr:hypothetical protein CRE_16917 [Caenorhabditis remanei]